MRPDLYRMFYPLDEAAQEEWARIVQLPEPEYATSLREQAEQRGFRQEEVDEALAWLGPAGNTELMLFRIPDPGHLETVRDMYDLLAETGCPIAYAFVNQRGDAADAWDVFQLSRLSYLCHCNRISGPGAGCEA